MLAPDQADALIESLGRIEMEIRGIQQRASTTYKGILWERTAFPVERRRRVNQGVEAMLGEIRQMADGLCLARKSQDLPEAVQRDVLATQAALHALRQRYVPPTVSPDDQATARIALHLKRVIDLTDQVLWANADEP